MLKTVLLVYGVCFLCFGGSQRTTKKKSNTIKEITIPPYPELYRDHVYYGLSDKAKETFYAVDIHPLCSAKKGRCIPRGQCIMQDMLYISRVCYKRDLVCCFDKSIHFPSVASNEYVPPEPLNKTDEVYIEPPVEP